MSVEAMVKEMPQQARLQRVQAAEKAGERAAKAQQWPLAAREYGQAAELAPGSAVLQLHLARSFLNMGDPARALPAARRAVELQPTQLLAYRFWVECLAQLNRHEEAAEACATLPAEVERDADFCLAHANALLLSGQAKESIPVYMQTLKFNVQNPMAHYRLGLAMQQLRMGAQSAICFETAVLTSKSDASSNVRALALSLLVGQLAQEADWPKLGVYRNALLEELTHAADARIEELAPFTLLAVDSSPQQQRRIAHLRSRMLTRDQRALPKLPKRKPGGRIRIGYVSADFSNHATVLLMAELLELQDRERFEIFLYCHSANDGSEQRRRIRAAADQMRDVGQMADADIARLMREDGIDIAVDLKGHTRDSRMQLFGLRPASVQVSYLGFPGTTGADFIDYVVGDTIVTPLAHEGHFSERIAQMPHSYQPNDSRRSLPLAPPRAALGLPEGAVVLCCFNQSYKINPEMVDLWGQILRAVPNAVLWLLSWTPQLEQKLKAEFEARGVAADRLIFAPLVSPDENLARLQCADLFLDTWPCNAHTTASEALWAGVPVLTVPGQTFASRVAASLVTACGQAEFVCSNAQRYVDKAVALTHDLETLHAAQRHLREQRLNLPLFDSASYARDFDSLLQRMWARHEAGLAPAHLVA